MAGHEGGAAPSRQRRRRRGRVDAAVVAMLLSALAVRPSGADLETLDDGTPMLVAPWTEQEHSTACPSPDPRICPVLTLNNPTRAVFIRSQEDTVILRDVVPLSEEEIEKGATTPFFIYDYRYDSDQGAKRYMEPDTADNVEITFTTSMGRTWYDVADAAACGIITDVDTLGVLEKEATLETGPLSFSITDQLPEINCFLRSVRFSKTGGEISSDMQLAQYGSMSSLEVYVRSAVATENYNSAYKVRTIIFYDSIMFQPRILTCPSFSYPYPNAAQLPGAPAMEQPISIPTWDRTQLGANMGGQCLTTPMQAYPDELPVGSLACPNMTYAAGRKAPTCMPCFVTTGTWLYVFEDSPTTLTLSDIAFEDGAFFYGSVDLKLELEFGTHHPDAQDDAAVLTAQQGDLSKFDYCAHTSVASTSCASRSEDAFGNSWVPPANTQWGADYTMRIVASTDNAVMCKPGSLDCDTTSVGSGADRVDNCVDPGDVDDAGQTWCPCKSGLCYTVNAPRNSQSRIVKPDVRFRCLEVYTEI